MCVEYVWFYLLSFKKKLECNYFAPSIYKLYTRCLHNSAMFLSDHSCLTAFGDGPDFDDPFKALSYIGPDLCAATGARSH